MSATPHPVFTIGHSNHSPEAFLKLLRMNNIEDIIDVRSSPYSRYIPHFSYDALNRALNEVGITYVFLGGELGGRPADRSCYDADGRVRYDLLAQTDSFDDGIRCIMRHADERRISLMCSEKDPLNCHRTVLVAKTLVERGVAVEHILVDGSLETYAASMARLLDVFKLPYLGDLFRSGDEMIADALSRQAKKVAFVGEKSHDGDDWEDIP